MQLWIRSTFRKHRLFLAITVAICLLTGTVLAFSNHWSTQFNSSNDLFGLWRQFMVGDCGGQNHSVSGGLAHLAASYGTDCFGAFYRDSYNGSPNTFPTDQVLSRLPVTVFDTFSEDHVGPSMRLLLPRVTLFKR